MSNDLTATTEIATVPAEDPGVEKIVPEAALGPFGVDVEKLKERTQAALAGTTETREEEPWETEVRKKLISLAESPLTVKSAHRISEFAKLSGELVSCARNELPPPRRRRNAGWIGLGGEEDYPGMTLGPIVNPAETFGAKIVRELLAAIPRIQRKGNPMGTVRAIAEAKKLGLNDVAAQLKAELLDEEGSIAALGSQKQSLCAGSGHNNTTGTKPLRGLDASLHDLSRKREGALVGIDGAPLVPPIPIQDGDRIQVVDVDDPERDVPVDVVEFPAPGSPEELAQAQAHVAEYKEALDNLPDDLPPGVDPAFVHEDGSLTIPHSPLVGGGATTLSPSIARNTIENEGVDL